MQPRLPALLKTAKAEGMTVPLDGTPAIQSTRRGLLKLQDETLFSGRNPEALTGFLRRAFSCPELLSVEINAGKAVATLRYHFHCNRKQFLLRLAKTLKAPIDEGAPLVRSVAHLTTNHTPLTFLRQGEAITTWRIIQYRKGLLRCTHPLLQASVEARWAAEETLATLRGVREVRHPGNNGCLVIRYDPRLTTPERILQSLEDALCWVTPHDEFLAPTWRGYAYDSISLIVAAIGQSAFPPFLLLSAGLLIGGNWHHLRGTAEDLKSGKIGLNGLVTGVVGLTLYNHIYLHAAIMALAVRSWKGIEHATTVAALRQHVRSAHPINQKINRRNARLLARGTLSAINAEGRARRLADRAAAPTLLAGAAGIAISGPAAALAAIRPDYYSGPRIGLRLEGLACLLECARRDIYLLHINALEDVRKARTWVLDARLLAEGDPRVYEMALRQLKERGCRIVALHTEASQPELPEPFKLDAVERVASAAEHAQLLEEQTDHGQSAVYLGQRFSWDRPKPDHLACFYLRNGNPADIPPEADGVFAHGELQLVPTLLEEADRHHATLCRGETVCLTANLCCTAGAILFAMQTWQVVVITNLATGAVYAITRRRLREPHKRALHSVSPLTAERIPPLAKLFQSHPARKTA